MKLDNYLGRTVATAMVLASLGLVGILVLFTFLDQMQDVRSDYTVWTVARYVSYSLPRLFYDTVPYAALIGCLTGLGLLANSSEIIVMRSAGISTWQITRAVMKPALVLAVISLLVGEFLLPDFERTARVVKEDAIESHISPEGGFWYREGNTFMHFRGVSRDAVLKDINQYHLAGQEMLSRVLWAERGTYHAPDSASGQRRGFWLLHNVIATDFQDTGKTITRLDQLKWETTLTPDILSTEILVEPNMMSMLELRSKIKHMEAQGQSTRKLELGLWTKLFQPVASLSLVLVAVSFIFGPLREASMGMRVVTGLVIGILFKFLQDLLSPASLVFGFSPLIATLLPVLVCLGAGFVLLRRAR